MTVLKFELRFAVCWLIVTVVAWAASTSWITRQTRLLTTHECKSSRGLNTNMRQHLLLCCWKHRQNGIFHNKYIFGIQLNLSSFPSQYLNGWLYIITDFKSFFVSIGIIITFQKYANTNYFRDFWCTYLNDYWNIFVLNKLFIYVELSIVNFPNLSRRQICSTNSI